MERAGPFGDRTGVAHRCFIGCKEFVPRGDMVQHEQEQTCAHIRLAAGSAQAQYDMIQYQALQIQKMSKEMEQLTVTLGALIAEHKVLVTEHKKTQDRLVAKEKEKKAKDLSGNLSSLKERRQAHEFVTFAAARSVPSPRVRYRPNSMAPSSAFEPRRPGEDRQGSRCCHQEADRPAVS
jgi:hypothetical protein